MSDTPELPEPDCGLGVHRNTYSSDLMRSYAAECVRAALAAQAEAYAGELAGLESVRAEQAAGREYWCNEAQRLTAERDALRADAERYRWLRDHFLGVDFEWGEESTPVLLISWPDDGAVWGSLDLTIDAARAQGGTLT